MKTRYLFMSFGVFAIVYAALLIVAPQAVGNIGSVAAEAEFLSHINQSRAPTLLGLGVLAWMFRDRDAEPATAIALVGLCIANFVLAIALALAQFTAAATSFGWLLVALYATWGIGFGYLRFGNRRGGSNA